MMDGAGSPPAGGESTEERGERVRVLLGVTGSVAALKAPALARAVLALNTGAAGQRHYEVRAVVTARAEHFLRAGAAEGGGRLEEAGVAVFRDDDEWTWQARGDPVLHVELARWADALVLAPLSAHSLARLAGGLCDDLLACVARAWPQHKPRLAVPAMNTHMWTHPLTSRHLAELQQLGYRTVPVQTKRLVCGDTGAGAMAEPDTIVRHLLAALAGAPPPDECG